VGLLDEAAAFTREILEDVDGGFGQVVTVTDPFGKELDAKGFSKSISQVIDPQTGMMVSGKYVSVTLPIGVFVDAGWGLPRGTNSPDEVPWVVSFADVAGVVSRFKVRETMPDRTLGTIVCVLEDWDG
jgi:hypothetical protein